jgi:N-acetylglucosaminyldiphosphoundecaprenol N-acetyl-beta-D-mannosaminyltransferase
MFFVYSLATRIVQRQSIVSLLQRQRNNRRKNKSANTVHHKICRKKERSVFFFGASESVLMAIAKKVSNEFPNIKIAGYYPPPFVDELSEEQNTAAVDIINAAAADILWGAMTAPKQEKWIRRNREKLDVKFIGAIGAVFDYYSGVITRNFLGLERIGLEWLVRLVQNPLKLWRRTLISAPKFTLFVLKRAIFKR